jgi:DNA sulfur modification protein DndC
MSVKKESGQVSIFSGLGFKAEIDSLKADIQSLYLEDQIPWVIGYSGGKDSTAVLQLVWLAISELSKGKLTKPIHVISTDTLVENPIVAAWVSRSLEAIQNDSKKKKLPFQAHRLTPEVKDSFWVNLIGKGYPAPRNKFRWCTERLKINPSNNFIRRVVQESGEAILVLGTRKAESSTRSSNMKKYEQNSVRDMLVQNASLPNSLVYTPIQDWSNDDVWTFLMQVSNPWGNNNKDLLTMYRGASADGECPLVVDTSTPSCGNSRFGCWVCTLVDEDKSMGAMIQNDDEKEWMLPMLEFRNELDFRTEEARKMDRKRRDFRRMSGYLSLYTDRDEEAQLVPGPYKQKARSYWLERVLSVQKWVRENGPDYVRDISLISDEELEAIRKIWVVDKHEIEDLLPKIYEKSMQTTYSGASFDDNLMFDEESLAVLKELCGNDEMHFELSRNLLDLERRYRTMITRRGLFSSLEKTVEKCFYDGKEDALGRAQQRHEWKNLKWDEDRERTTPSNIE